MTLIHHFMICSTQRTGSTLLSNLLMDLGLFGYPREYFDPVVVLPETASALGLSSADEVWSDIDSYVERLKERYSSPRGLFGLKIHWHDFAAARAAGFEIDRHLPRARFIYITRGDVVAQAISAELAEQTRSWVSLQRKDGLPTYDPDRITSRIRRIADGNVRWEAFFRERGALPYRINYERLVGDMKGELVRIASFLGVDLAAEEAARAQSGLDRQIDPLKPEWYSRYQADISRSAGAAAPFLGVASSAAPASFIEHRRNDALKSDPGASVGPLVSIIVNNYNYARFVGPAIESALAQTYSRCEVIVVDDGSTDDSPGVIEQYRDRIEIIRQPNRGQGAAFNTGFAASRGDLILLLDSDDVLKSHAIEAVVGRWRQGAAFAQFGLELIDHKGRAIGLHPLSTEMAEGDVWSSHMLCDPGFYGLMPTSGNVFSRRVLERILPLPEEDWRICADGYVIRLSTFFGPVIAIREVLGQYRAHGDNAFFDPVGLRPRHDPSKAAQFARSAHLVARFLVREHPEMASDVKPLAWRRCTDWQLDAGEETRRSVRRSVAWSGLVESLRGDVPLRHRVLYLGYFSLLLLGADRHPQLRVLMRRRSATRPPRLSRFIDRLKGRDFDRPPLSRWPAPLPIGSSLTGGVGGSIAPLLGRGWRAKQPDHHVSAGLDAVIHCVQRKTAHPLRWVLEMASATNAPQNVLVLVDGTLIGKHLVDQWKMVEFISPARTSPSPVVVTLEFPDAVEAPVPPIVPVRPPRVAVKLYSLRVDEAREGEHRGAIPLAPGSEEIDFARDPAARRYLRDGWRRQAGEGIAMVAPVARIAAEILLPAKDLVLCFEASPASQDLETPLELFANGAPLGRHIVRKRGFYELPLSPQWVRGRSSLMLKFRVRKDFIGAHGAIVLHKIGARRVPRPVAETNTMDHRTQEFAQHDGNLKEAADSSNTTNEKKAKVVKGYRILGQVLHQRGNLKQAADLLRKAIELDPRAADPYRRLGLILQQQGELKEAISVLHKAIELEPRAAESHRILSLILQQKGEIKEAADILRKAIELEPRAPESYRLLAQVLQRQGKLDEAADALSQAIALQPHVAESHHNLGQILKRQGKPDEAADAFRKAIECDPKAAESYCMLGEILQSRGNLDEAADVLRKGIEHKIENAQLYHDFGNVLKQQGSLDEAADALRRASELKPEFFGAFHPFGRAATARAPVERPPESSFPYPKLFIVGCARSGTTWFRDVFAEHPQVISGPESHLYDNVFKPITSLNARRKSAWDYLLELYRQKEGGNRFGVHSYVDEQGYIDILNDVRRQLYFHPEWTDEQIAVAVIGGILDSFFYSHGGATRRLLVEKTPNHVFIGKSLLRFFPESKVLDVVRDGRDVCVSLQMRSREQPWVPKSRKDQIRLWRDHVREGMKLLENPDFQGRVMRFHYEEMKSDPASSIARLYSFAGLGFDAGLIEQVVRNTDFRRHSDIGPNEHNRKGVVGDWRNHFTEEDVELFKNMAGDLFEQCGYRFD